MLAVEHCSEFFADVALPENELLEIHRSKISLHHAKTDSSYPTMRLPTRSQRSRYCQHGFVRRCTMGRPL